MHDRAQRLGDVRRRLARAPGGGKDACHGNLVAEGTGRGRCRARLRPRHRGQTQQGRRDHHQGGRSDPRATLMSLPRVYGAISAITAAFAHHGLPKERINRDEGYAYRAIDEVVERLAPLLAEHNLCILPRVLERTQGERTDPEGQNLIHVVLRVAFDLVSVEDGSSHTIEAIGEALDHGDKASAKAMTSAYKHAVLHAFCIPASGREDPDRSSPCPSSSGRSSSGRGGIAALPAPVEGWVQWAEDIAAVVESCVTPEAIERLLASNRAQLSALAREQPTAYARVGWAIASRRKVLAQPVAASVTPEAAGVPAAHPGAKASRLAKPERAKRASTIAVAEGLAAHG
ncbi:hypothetical protein GKE62_17805 [Novosphingobium sp. Gsoil 351]|nr:hypothetical protein GKE62_17805 [Novosphingobium sp. Gsoil 351]